MKSIWQKIRVKEDKEVHDVFFYAFVTLTHVQGVLMKFLVYESNALMIVN